MKKYWTWILAVVFLFGFLVRLYHFNGPVADWHSFRQGDTNAVSQVYVNEGINFLYPRFFDISNVPSGIYDNPKGYRFVEFPIYNALQASLFNVVGVLTLTEWGRILSILATLVGAYFIYLLTKKYVNSLAGLLASVFYLFLPFSIYYGRTILPDPSTAATITGGIYFFDAWFEKNGKLKKQSIEPIGLFFLAVAFTATAFLLKPFALFFTLPMVYLAWERYGINLIKRWPLWVFLVLSVAPLAGWRLWISQYPEGIPQSAWLLNGNGIRFRPAFFRWIFYERLTKLILGFVGLIFFIAGFVGLRRTKNPRFILSIILSALVYVVVVATGNVQHDYYQILIIPALSIICGIGMEFLLSLYKSIIWKVLLFVILIATFALGWFGVTSKGLGGGVVDYFNINDRGMVAAGQKANEILPKNAIVIAPYDGSTTLLNIIARPGWYSFQKDINGLVKMGATHLVIANPTPNDFSGFGQTYPVVASSSSYLILKLK